MLAPERTPRERRTNLPPEERGAELIVFPGRDRPRAPTYGPFKQEGHLDGVLISVGGKGDTINLRLQNGATTYSGCETTRTIARELAKHLFELVRIWPKPPWSSGGTISAGYDATAADRTHEQAIYRSAAKKGRAAARPRSCVRW